jgi:hypothetical protein
MEMDEGEDKEKKMKMEDKVHKSVFKSPWRTHSHEADSLRGSSRNILLQ